MADSHDVQEQAVSDYVKVGGGPAVTAVVDYFYENVIADPQLTGYFEGVDLSRLKRHQVLLVSQVLGGPAQYDGRDLAAAHAGLGVTSGDFDRVVEHLVEAMEKFQVPPDIIGRVGTVLAGTEPDIVADQPAS
jgi:hemoglobin